MQNLTQESTCCRPRLARTVSRAVAFGGLQLIRRKSLTKRCLKLLVTEFLNLLLKKTEVFVVCFVLVLFVSKLQTFCKVFYRTKFLVVAKALPQRSF